MTIYQRMQAVFEAVGVKGYLQTRETSEDDTQMPDTYCTYVVVSDGSALAADDQSIVNRFDVRIDLHGKRDTSQTLSELLIALDAAGFSYVPVRHLDGQVKGSKYKYHQRITATHFSYFEEE